MPQSSIKPLSLLPFIYARFMIIVFFQVLNKIVCSKNISGQSHTKNVTKSFSLETIDYMIKNTHTQLITFLMKYRGHRCVTAAACFMYV